MNEYEHIRGNKIRFVIELHNKHHQEHENYRRNFGKNNH